MEATRLAEGRRRMQEATGGVYDAKRAAALAGVPVATVYSWARRGLVVPSVSPERVKLWSWADLVKLRLAHWLRHPKREAGALASSMAEVEAAFTQIADEDLDLWSIEPQARILVQPDGHIVIDRGQDDRSIVSGQGIVPGTADLIGPYDGEAGARGPDLVRPRPHLRIVPGKVAGEPHLEGSRLTTPTLAALDRRGFTIEQIHKLYPGDDVAAIREAVELERSLAA